MKQLLQSLRSGETMVADVPVPRPGPGMALVRNAASLVSAGTERTLVEFAEKSLLGKAQSRPDLVRQVLNKARREGIVGTVSAAFNRLDQPTTLGYSSAGTIVEVGPGLAGFHPGDRVACAGGGYAVHAEYVVVPQNLMVKLPDEVDFESAAFTTLAAIAMQGFRLAELQLGERAAVIGLGLLGLLTVSIARAAGCQVFGVDLDPRRIALAQEMGAKAVSRDVAEAAGRAFTQDRGFDAVLVCADSRSADPMELAGALACDRAKVVAVGAVDLHLPRKVYYEKELQVIVSRSYGPGRYDPDYEEGGRDYPYGYVRWTENRNMQAAVELMASGDLNLQPLISHRFPIDQAEAAYQLITRKTDEPFLGVLLTYPHPVEVEAGRKVVNPAASGQTRPTDRLGIGVLGAGNYANAVFLPSVKAVGLGTRVGIASASGVSARLASQKYGFNYATTDEEALLADPEINVLAVLTRHQHHARQILAALQNGKHVFCEKPLAITQAELDEISGMLMQEGLPLLTVGFNRRFAPLAVRMKEYLQAGSEPLVAHYRVNAGYLPDSHWLHDPEQGGGRIIGEGCHFVDFLTFLVGSPPVSVRAHGLPDNGRYHEDNVVMTFTFADGSVGTVSYLANGDKSFPKERVEVFKGGAVAVLNDFRSLELVRGGRREAPGRGMGQDKGHRGLWKAFLEAVQRGGPPPISYMDLLGVTQATFAAVESLRSGQELTIRLPGQAELSVDQDGLA